MILKDKILKSECISEIISLTSKINRLRNLLEDIRARCDHSDSTLAFTIGNFDVKICPDCGNKISVWIETDRDTKNGQT